MHPLDQRAQPLPHALLWHVALAFEVGHEDAFAANYRRSTDADGIDGCLGDQLSGDPAACEEASQRCSGDTDHVR